MVYLKYIAQLLLLLIIVRSAFHWIRTGFWVPKYIHFISFIMFLIAGSLSYLAYSVNDANANKTIYLVIGFPIAVYIIYGLYGGGMHSKEIKINEYCYVDRAMIQNDVITIFNEHFVPYTKWSFENLLLLSANQHISEVTGKSGKVYLLEIAAEPYGSDEEDKKIAIYGRLTDLSKKFYKPQSHIVYEIGKSGTVYRDGVNFKEHQVSC